MNKSCHRAFQEINFLLTSCESNQYEKLAKKLILWLKANSFIFDNYDVKYIQSFRNFLSIDNINNYTVNNLNIDTITLSNNLNHYITKKYNYLFDFLLDILERLFFHEVDVPCTCDMQYPQRIVKIPSSGILCIECWFCSRRRDLLMQYINLQVYENYIIPTTYDLAKYKII